MLCIIVKTIFSIGKNTISNENCKVHNYLKTAEFRYSIFTLKFTFNNQWR